MERKLRYSKQREMIYQYLCASHEHPSADMVYEALKNQISNLSLGTVYRNLKVLEEIGQVRRVTTLQNVERYDAFCHDHAHFVCSKCGSVTDMPAAEVSRVKQEAEQKSHNQVQWVNLSFGGVCNRCLQKEKIN